MEKSVLSHHISQQFNVELENLRTRVFTMGGLVEQQVRDAVQALTTGNVELANAVIENDYKVNAMEVGIDEDCTHIIARRQPAASDLRLLIAVIKTITDLERIGDQAKKVAFMGRELANMERPHDGYHEIQSMGGRVQGMVSLALDAFARLDVTAAVQVAKEDVPVDKACETIMRSLMNDMMQDPGDIKRALDVMWSTRALERIGDHAKNMSEYVIYLVQGKDVRHISLERLEKEAEKPRGAS